MGGDIYIYAFTEAFDAKYTLVSDIRKSLAQCAPLQIFIDSKQVFDLITCGKRPTEQRLSIDVTAVRETCRCRKIDFVGLNRCSERPVDFLTKFNGNFKLDAMI